MNTTQLSLGALRELGIRALADYGLYRLALGSGRIRRRTPMRLWQDRPLDAWLIADVSLGQAIRRREPFFFDPQADLAAPLERIAAGAELPATKLAAEILHGEFRLFGGAPLQLGFPPGWNVLVDAEQGGAPQALPADRHWTAYDLDGASDYKLVWELSRFGWMFLLGRAYRQGQERGCWEACWELLESWRGQNPPNCGPQWISAQEVAIRLLALVFGWHAFAPDLDEAPDRAAAWLSTIAAHADRIPPTIRYARAQRNNHLLVEAVGLYSAGLLFPCFRKAARWKQLGRRELLGALEDQVFADGGYIQHSTNYHRLALQASLWAARLAAVHQQALPRRALEAIDRMGGCLGELIDPQSGRLPNLGHNDGSEMLPLSATEYGDHRPAVQAASRMFGASQRFGSGPWDEFSFWLGLEPPAGQRRPAGFRRAEAFPQAGLYLMQGERSWGMLRCARFHSRPAHSDQLNLDLWWQGHNIVRDPGSYRYTAPAPWDNALAEAAAHNAPVLLGCEPMKRAGRFRWTDWAQAELLGRWRSPAGSLESLMARHRGYRSNSLTVQRTVLRAGDELWLVVDELLGGQHAPARLIWTLPDWPWEIAAQGIRLRGTPGSLQVQPAGAAAGLSLYRAGERLAGEAIAPATRLGWWSPSYNQKRPALSLVVGVARVAPARVETWFRLGDPGGDDPQVDWREPRPGEPPLASVSWNAEVLEL